MWQAYIKKFTLSYAVLAMKRSKIPKKKIKNHGKKKCIINLQANKCLPFLNILCSKY